MSGVRLETVTSRSRPSSAAHVCCPFSTLSGIPIPVRSRRSRPPASRLSDRPAPRRGTPGSVEVERDRRQLLGKGVRHLGDVLYALGLVQCGREGLGEAIQLEMHPAPAVAADPAVLRAGNIADVGRCEHAPVLSATAISGSWTTPPTRTRPRGSPKCCRARLRHCTGLRQFGGEVAGNGPH